MFWDERGFAQVTTAVKPEIKTPALQDKNDINLFKGITQEHVDMLARVRKEKKERIFEDSKLWDEMHSFGTITSSPLVDATRFYYLHMNQEVITLPCKDVAGTAASLSVDMRRDVMLHKSGSDAESIYLEGECHFVDGYSVAVCAYIQKNSGKVVVYCSLGGAAYINGMLYIPAGRDNFVADIDDIDAYT